jgi:hypothetical protein
MLRRVVLLVSGLVLVGAVALTVAGVSGATPMYVWVAVQAALLLVLVLGERGRYRPPASDAAGGWQRTAERFQDPTTGQWVVVEYNSRTGQRRYVQESQL